MPSPVKTYQSEMHENLGFFATWLPGDPIDVGDVGILEGGRFRRMTTLRELGVAFEVADAGAISDVQYSSKRGTSVKASGGANAPGIARAEISIDFSAVGSFVFHAAGLQASRLENRRAVAEALVKLFTAREWQADWLLVESIHSARRATVVVSEDDSAQLVLGAAGPALLPSASLADPRVDLALVATRGKVFHAIGARDLHPLYSCLRIEAPLFRKAELQPVRGPAADVQPLVRTTIEELLES